MRRSKKNSSKNTFFLVAAIVSVSVAAIYFVFNDKIEKSPTAAVKKPGDVIVAEVNGQPVYSSEAEKQFSTMVQGAKGASFENLDDDAKYVVIRELAAQKLILEDAYKKGVPDKDTVKEKVSAFKNNIIKQEFLAQMAKDQVTEESIKQRYETEKAGLKDKSQFKIKHIVVKTEGEAKKIKNLLKKKKKSFEKLAKDKSIDDKTALIGGDLGYLIEGDMMPAIQDAIKDLEAGGVSKPVKTVMGWHIFKLEEKSPAQALPFDQVKGLLARALYQETIQTYLKATLENASIEVIVSAKKEEPAAAVPAASSAPAAISNEPPASAPAAESGEAIPDAETGAVENNG